MSKPVLFSAAGLGHQVGPGSLGKPSMLLAAREFDEYEDEDSSDDSDENAEGKPHCIGPEASTVESSDMIIDEVYEADEVDGVDEVDAQDPRYSKYGIGARLMLKMGFQPGQGLGKSGAGIVEPIKTNVRPSKSGVGAVPENGSSKKRYYPLPSTAKRSSSLFESIQYYEGQGVQVPELFKELCDNGDPIQASKAVVLLDDFAKDWLSTKAQLQLQENLASVADSNEKEARAQLAATEAVIDTIESCVSHEVVGIDQITATLQVLIRPDCDACPDRMAAFASLADTHLSSLVSAALSLSTQAMDTLLEWSHLCRAFADSSLSTKLCAYDLALYAQVRLHVQGLFDDESSVLDVVGVLVEQPIFVDTITAVQIKLTHEVLMPWLENLVESWQPFVEDPPLAVIEHMVILSPEGGTFRPLVQKVADKYVDVLDHNTVDAGSIMESLKSLERWRLVFANSGVPDNIHIALLKYICEQLTVRMQSPASPSLSPLLRVLKLATNVLNSYEMKFVLEFCLFNPWVVQARQRAYGGQMDLNWMKVWLTVFQGVCAAIPLVTEMCEWYVNAFLDEKTTAKPWPMPNLHGAISVETADIVLHLTDASNDTSTPFTGAAGEATALYSTQFKDVLSHYCSLNNIECTATKETNNVNGQYLFRLKWPDSRTGYCYIEENVVFVSESRAGKFAPTSLRHLQEWGA